MMMMMMMMMRRRMTTTADDDDDTSATAHQIGELCGEASAPIGQMMQIILMRQKLKY